MRLRLVLVCTLFLVHGQVRAGYKEGLVAFKGGDYIGAFRTWTPLAQQGDPDAEYGLSLLYGQGLGVAEDTDYAFILMRSAAEGGVTQAQLNMGNHYNAGRWVRRSPLRAAFWWRQAAEKDVVSAQYNLGTLYYYGRGVALDRLRARYWFERGVQLDCSRCKQALAIMDKQDREAGRIAAPAKPPADAEETAVTPIGKPVAAPVVARSEAAPEVATSRVVASARRRSPAPVAKSRPKPKPVAAKPPPKPQSRAADAEPPKVPAGVVAASRARPRPAPAPGNQWVLGQPPGNFTVQLFASDKPDSVENYRRSHPWGARLVVFQFKYLGRPWQALVFGSFSDKRSARIMASRTPSPAGAGRPWVRQLGAMQSLLTKR